jgi:hypothetical protein
MNYFVFYLFKSVLFTLFNDYLKLLDDVLSLRIVVGRFHRSFWTFMHFEHSSNVPLFLIKRSTFKDQMFDKHVTRSMMTRNAKLEVFKTKNTQ